MDYHNIITIEPGKRSGKPCIRGLRITVSDVLEYLASGMTEDQILQDTRTSRGGSQLSSWPSAQGDLVLSLLQNAHAAIIQFEADPEASFLALG